MIAESQQPSHVTNPQRKNTEQANFTQLGQHPQHRTQYPGYYMTMEYNPKEEQRKSQRFRRKNQPLLRQALVNVAQTLGLIFESHEILGSSELLENLQKQNQNHKSSSHQEPPQKIHLSANLSQPNKQKPNPQI